MPRLVRKLTVAAGSSFAIAAILAIAPVAIADPPAITSAQADEILAELRKIRQLLERSGPPVIPAAARSVPATGMEKVSVAVRDAPALGSINAPLTLVEFADYQCPFCRNFDTTVFDELKKKFIDTGKLRYVSHDLPMPMHDHATQAASAARCAGDQNQFWELRHVLMMNAQKLEHDDLIRYAHDLHLDVGSFTHCIDEGKYDAVVRRDAADAVQIGVTGTPTFVLGRTRQDGPFEGIKLVGVQPYGVFEFRIRELLDDHAIGADASAPVLPAAPSTRSPTAPSAPATRFPKSSD